jgi:hypothetical protein
VGWEENRAKSPLPTYHGKVVLPYGSLAEALAEKLREQRGGQIGLIDTSDETAVLPATGGAQIETSAVTGLLCRARIVNAGDNARLNR